MKYLLSFALTSLLSFQALAADLKDKDVAQWINAMQVLAPWLEEHETQFTAHITEPNNPEVAFRESVIAIKSAGLYDELNDKVTKLGFDNVEQWSETTQKVTSAWMALEMASNESQIKIAKAQYEAMKINPDIPADQKAAMEKMMAPALSMIRLAATATTGDKTAVKLHQKSLEAFFETAH